MKFIDVSLLKVFVAVGAIKGTLRFDYEYDLSNLVFLV